MPLFPLFHQCLSFPKFVFSFRTCPQEFSSDAAFSLDGSVRNILSDREGSPISDWSWLKAYLPVLRGVSISAQLLRPFHWFLKSFHLIPSLPGLITPSLPLLRQLIVLPGLHRSLSRLISASSPSVLMISVSISYFLQPQIATLVLWFSHPLSLTPCIDWLSVVPSFALKLHMQDV